MIRYDKIGYASGIIADEDGKFKQHSDDKVNHRHIYDK